MTKRCPACKKTLPVASFSKNKAASDGLVCWCKPCASERKLRERYGMSSEQKEELFIKQLRLCAICKTDQPRGNHKFVIDHDHLTGKVRSILCGNCNQGLGQFNDSPELLIAAAEYLKAHAQF